MEKCKSAEEIRAERIADLRNAEARGAIEKVLEERKAKLIELREKQNQTYEKHVAARIPPRHINEGRFGGDPPVFDHPGALVRPQRQPHSVEPSVRLNDKRN